VRPAQQVLSSPVDKWGIQMLLYTIRTQLEKTDRGVLMFGEDLSELGVDMTSEQCVSNTCGGGADADDR
jgi:CCR4-NOT transcription complex subunit 2